MLNKMIKKKKTPRVHEKQIVAVMDEQHSSISENGLIDHVILIAHDAIQKKSPMIPSNTRATHVGCILFINH